MDAINKLLDQFCPDVLRMTPEQIAEHDKKIERLEALQAERDKIEKYQKSGAPERYWAESLDTYRTSSEMQKQAARAVVDFIREVKCGAFRSLVLIGHAGTGKTHLACAIIRETGGKYRTASDIVEEIQRAKSFTATETEAEIVNYYGHVPVLVLDEIGRGIAAADEKYMIYQVLNARYNTRKPTVLISNHTKAGFLKYIGAAAADRLVESGEILEMNGESYRRELRGQGAGMETARHGV